MVVNKYSVELQLENREFKEGTTKKFHYRDYELPLDTIFFGKNLIDEMVEVHPEDWEDLPYDEKYLLLEIDVDERLVYRFVKRKNYKIIHMRMYETK